MDTAALNLLRTRTHKLHPHINSYFMLCHCVDIELKRFHPVKGVYGCFLHPRFDHQRFFHPELSTVMHVMNHHYVASPGCNRCSRMDRKFAHPRGGWNAHPPDQKPSGLALTPFMRVSWIPSRRRQPKWLGSRP